jgi:hypothetical protein
MRLGLVILLSLLMTGCAIWRKDKEEPVENRSEREKAEPVLKPSEALKPEKNNIASPITDRFYMRGSAFQGTVDTTMRVDSTNAGTADGTVLSGEDDLGLDDQVEQFRMEFNVRLHERHNVRVDYFRLDRFHQVTLDQPISFGDFDFLAGDTFRTKLDYSTLSVSYTYSFVKTERFEWGIGLGAYLFDLGASGGEPGTLKRDDDTEAGAFPTGAMTMAYRISKRWAVSLRNNQLKLIGDEDAKGGFREFHGDVQYRWRKNFAVGLGYTMTKLDLELRNVDEPFRFNMEATGPELFFRAAF